MKSDDPIIQSIYEALTLLPAAEIALAEVARHDRCEAQHRRLAEHLLRQVRERKVFADRDRRDLDALLNVLRVWVEEGRERCWVHDEHCMSGGWYETVIPPALAVINGHYMLLDRLHTALRTVRDVTDAHRLSYQFSI